MRIVSEFHQTSAWQRARRRARPLIEASLPLPCIDCGWPVLPGDGSRWEVGHITPVSIARGMGWSDEEINALSNLGPSHRKGPGQRACNRIAGGRLGAAKTNAARAAARGGGQSARAASEDDRIGSW